MPNLEEIIRAQRAALLAHEATLAGNVEDLYAGAIQKIDARTKAAIALVQKRIDAGDNPLSALISENRIGVLTDQLEQELWKVGTPAFNAVEAERARVTLASAKDFVDATDAFDVQAGIDPIATQRMALALSGDSPVRRLFDALPSAAAQNARLALFTAVAAGDNPRKLAAAFRNAAGIARTRAATIARTETLRTYREAMRSRMQASQGITGWVWISARDRRTCPVCWSMHGSVHKLDEPMGTHPNCRCSQGPIHELSKLKVTFGSDEFALLDAGAQRHILGKANYNAYAAGRIKLFDLVGRAEHPDWGRVRFQRSLTAVLGSDAKKYYARQPKPPTVKAPRAGATKVATGPNPRPALAEMVDSHLSPGWQAVRNAGPGGLPDTAPNSLASTTHLVKYKAAVSSAIGKDLTAAAKANPAIRTQMDAYAKAAGLNPGQTGNVIARHLVGEWASTSADSSGTALALQERAAAKFGVPIAPHLGTALAYDYNAQAVRIAQAGYGDLLDTFLDSQYKATQTLLKAQGIESVTLYRGMSTTNNLPANQYTYSNSVTLQPLSSFSTDYYTATRFTAYGERTIVAMKVPVEKILSTPATGNGCLNEGEFVVIGGVGLPAHVVSAGSALTGSVGPFAFTGDPTGGRAGDLGALRDIIANAGAF